MITFIAGLTIQQALKQATNALQVHSASAKLDAEVLLAHCIERDRTYLVTWPERCLTAAQAKRYQVLIEQRLAGHPVAHLLGEREFWSLPLFVNSSTLIPRPDTEVLVEQALALALPEHAQVLDLGTGTGAIALALKHSRPNWRLTAVDKMPDAVTLAKRNAERLQLAIEIKQSDWFANVPVISKYNLVVSNPPYIDADDPHLQQGDVRFEPHSALIASDHGLADIQHIISCARDYLAVQGWLLIEHGYQQAAAVRANFADCGYTHISTVQDYAQLDRVTLGQWRPEHE
jgi:release factor glutamine methyltransferase